MHTRYKKRYERATKKSQSSAKIITDTFTSLYRLIGYKKTVNLSVYTKPYIYMRVVFL